MLRFICDKLLPVVTLKDSFVTICYLLPGVTLRLICDRELSLFAISLSLQNHGDPGLPHVVQALPHGPADVQDRAAELRVQQQGGKLHVDEEAHPEAGHQS